MVSRDWVRVSRERPCPICGKADNCSTSRDSSAVWCGRVSDGSIQSNAGGQFLHRLREGRGYDHPGWERAHRSIVRSAIIQAAGRGRTLLETGCDVVVISTEECGVPVADNADIELTECEAEALAELAGLSAEIPYRYSKDFPPMCSPMTTAVLAQRLRLSERRTREILTRLESRRLICRDGERGGWSIDLRDQPDHGDATAGWLTT